VTRTFTRLPLLLLALSILAANPSAQRAAKAPAVADDADFAAFVKSATTKPEFSSPLVDHLPKKAGVPAPKDVLGYHVGAEKKLTYWADQQKWYRALEKALPGRIKTSVIGKTEEGREIMIVYVTSDVNLKNLDQNRASMRRLADPRGLSPDEAKKLVAITKPHYHLSAGLHSGETNTSEMLMELTYRLAVSDEPYIQQIRDNVIVSMVPTTDIDGRDRYVDWYYAYKIDEPYDGGENFGGPPYWGKYVFHDNNRDINYGVDTLRTYLKWYLEWVPPIWHDLHEAQTLLYTYSGGAPQNANWDPLLYSDLMFFANYEVSKMTGYGMPGVWHFGFMDAWSPGYLAIAAQNHNGMLRMYEIFNQGGANTKKARLQGNQTTRQWYRPNPASGEVDWSIRNSINYSQTAVLTALELTSKVPGMVVENYYKKAVNAVNKGLSKAPHAFVIPAGQGDQTKVDRMANLLRVQAIEVHRATSEVKVKEGTFPAGSFIVRLNQPYGPLAKTLLEKQVYPDPALQTYDDSAWTMGLANNVEVKTIEDKTILDAPATLLTADVDTAGVIADGADGVGGAGGVLAVRHNGALNLVTLRYRLKDVGFKGATASFKVGSEDYPAGSFIIPASDRARQEIQKLGLVATALPSAPDVATTDVDLPRLAIFTTWSNTEKVGWVRLAFDRFEVPFDLIHKDHMRQGNLRAKYDVIVMPHQGNSGKSIVYEQPKLSRPLAYRKGGAYKTFGFYTETDDVRGGMGLEGAAEMQKFVDEGGVLMTLGIASAFPAEFGIAKGVDTQNAQPGFYAPGPYVQSEIMIPTHPVVFGYDQKTLPVRYAGGPLLQAGPPPEAAAFLGASPFRPQVVARFVGGEAGVLSGVMRGADQIRNRPMIVDAPSGKGHVLLFTNNPIYRWQTFAEHEMVFNALMYWNDFPAATPPAKTVPTAQ
jgi:hypothetical protein